MNLAGGDSSSGGRNTFPPLSRHAIGLHAATLGHQRSPSPRRGGFTLVELMVVMVLIGIVTAMIVPEMKGTYQDALLRATSRDLVNVFSLASSHAVSLNQIHRVQFESRTGKYFLEKRVAGKARGENFVRVQDVAGSEGEVDTRVSVMLRQPSEAAPGSSEPEPVAATEPEADATETPGTITFYPDGTASRRELMLRDQEGFGLLLRLNPVTSRVRVTELGKETAPPVREGAEP